MPEFENPPRYAKVRSIHVQVIERYLPGNYRVTGQVGEWTYIAGHDVAGWTLQDYVIPRLASGLYHCEEMKDAGR
jgi:hypothetical protein